MKIIENIKSWLDKRKQESYQSFSDYVETNPYILLDLSKTKRGREKIKNLTPECVRFCLTVQPKLYLNLCEENIDVNISFVTIQEFIKSYRASLKKEWLGRLNSKTVRILDVQENLIEATFDKALESLTSEEFIGLCIQLRSEGRDFKYWINDYINKKYKEGELEKSFLKAYNVRKLTG